MTNKYRFKCHVLLLLILSLACGTSSPQQKKDQLDDTPDNWPPVVEPPSATTASAQKANAKPKRAPKRLMATEGQVCIVSVKDLPDKQLTITSKGTVMTPFIAFQKSCQGTPGAEVEVEATGHVSVLERGASETADTPVLLHMLFAGFETLRPCPGRPLHYVSSAVSSHDVDLCVRATIPDSGMITPMLKVVACMRGVNGTTCRFEQDFRMRVRYAD